MGIVFWDIPSSPAVAAEVAEEVLSQQALEKSFVASSIVFAKECSGSVTVLTEYDLTGKTRLRVEKSGQILFSRLDDFTTTWYTDLYCMPHAIILRNIEGQASILSQQDNKFVFEDSVGVLDVKSLQATDTETTFICEAGTVKSPQPRSFRFNELINSQSTPLSSTSVHHATLSPVVYQYDKELGAIVGKPHQQVTASAICNKEDEPYNHLLLLAFVENGSLPKLLVQNNSYSVVNASSNAMIVPLPFEAKTIACDRDSAVIMGRNKNVSSALRVYWQARDFFQIYGAGKEIDNDPYLLQTQEENPASLRFYPHWMTHP